MASRILHTIFTSNSVYGNGSSTFTICRRGEKYISEKNQVCFSYVKVKMPIRYLQIGKGKYTNLEAELGIRVSSTYEASEDKRERVNDMT